MTVKTKLIKKDFINILANYNLGEYKNYKCFANGLCQTTLLLQTTKGDFVLKYYENRSKKHVLFEVNIFNYLGKKKYPVPVIIKNLFGKFIGEHKKKSFVIIKYINGKHGKNPNDFLQVEKLYRNMRGRLSLLDSSPCLL